MTEAKEACSYKSAITKNQLMWMLTLLGGDRIGYMWTEEQLNRSTVSLVERGLLVSTRKDRSAVDERPSDYNSILTSFILTKRGLHYITKWTPQELLHEVNEYAKNNMLRIFPLFYIVSVSSVDFLPEFLTSPHESVREAAEKRLRKLSK